MAVMVLAWMGRDGFINLDRNQIKFHNKPNNVCIVDENTSVQNGIILQYTSTNMGSAFMLVGSNKL